MSAIPELSRSTIIAWRTFANTPAFEEGLDHLRRYHSPRAGGANEIEMVKSAIGWNYYTQAIDDIEEVLMKIPKKSSDIDEPGLESTQSPEV